MQLRLRAQNLIKYASGKRLQLDHDLLALQRVLNKRVPKWCGGGLATAENFGTVPKFSAESTDASQRYKLEHKYLCKFSKTAVTLRIICCDIFSFIRLLLLSYKFCFHEEKYMIPLSSNSMRSTAQ